MKCYACGKLVSAPEDPVLGFTDRRRVISLGIVQLQMVDR